MAFVSYVTPSRIEQIYRAEREAEAIRLAQEQERLTKRAIARSEADRKENLQQEARNTKDFLIGNLWAVQRTLWDETHAELYEDICRAVDRFKKVRLAEAEQ